MQIIPSLVLPDKYPPAAAIKSFNDDAIFGYNPAFWELDYNSNRYLNRVDINELSHRYNQILKNMKYLISRERNKIPRQVFLSSWYWFQKEHQTRYEFYLRGLDLPEMPPIQPIYNNHENDPARPSHPNAGDVLFRYCEPQYAIELVSKGKLRITAASLYQKMENDLARKDNELEKNSFKPGNCLKVKTSQGNEIPINGHLTRTASYPNYYTFCTSCEWDINLQNEFGGACVVINNVEQFTTRISAAAKKILKNWNFLTAQVTYYDPYDLPLKYMLVPYIHKDFRFAYQREWRFIWLNRMGINANGFFDLELGSLKNIASLV